MEQLWSDRALRLLLRATRRHSEAARTRFNEWMMREGLTLTSPIRTFQEQIDGLTYEVRGTGRVTHFGLIDELITDAVGRPYFECGDIDVAPCCLCMNLDGRLAVADGVSDPIIIASSAVVYIESDAVLDELLDMQSDWRWLHFGEVAKDDRRVDEVLELPLITQASDTYIRWWGNDRVRVNRHVFWADDPPRDRVIAYARSDEDAQRLMAALRDAVKVHTVQISSWPFRSDEHIRR